MLSGQAGRYLPLLRRKGMKMSPPRTCTLRGALVNGSHNGKPGPEIDKSYFELQNSTLTLVSGRPAGPPATRVIRSRHGSVGYLHPHAFVARLGGHTIVRITVSGQSRQIMMLDSLG